MTPPTISAYVSSTKCQYTISPTLQRGKETGVVVTKRCLSPNVPKDQEPKKMREAVMNNSFPFETTYTVENGQICKQSFTDGRFNGEICFKEEGPPKSSLKSEATKTAEVLEKFLKNPSGEETEDSMEANRFRGMIWTYGTNNAK